MLFDRNDIHPLHTEGAICFIRQNQTLTFHHGHHSCSRNRGWECSPIPTATRPAARSNHARIYKRSIQIL